MPGVWCLLRPVPGCVFTRSVQGSTDPPRFNIYLLATCPYHVLNSVSFSVCHSRLPQTHFLSISVVCSSVLTTVSLIPGHPLTRKCIIKFPTSQRLLSESSKKPVYPPAMCIKVVERYAVCRCIYYTHSIDPCPAYGRHDVKVKEVLVGYTCTRHSATRPQASSQYPTYSDSGYASQSNQSQNYQNYPKSFRR